MRRKEGSKTFESHFFSVCFYDYSGDQETTKNWRNIMIFFFLISKICALWPGNSQKLMMVPTQVNPQKTELNTVSTVFSFLNDGNSRNAFFSASVSCILALKLCCKMKAVFRNLENPKLLFNCTAPKGFMLQYSLFSFSSLFIVSL